MYWQYTTASAGAELRARAANPRRTLAAIPAAVTNLIERGFLRRMVILLIALANRMVTGAASGAAEHKVSPKGRLALT